MATIYHGRGGIRVLQNDFAGAVADHDPALSLEPPQFLFYISRGNARYHRRDRGGMLDYRMAFQLDAEGAARELVRIVTTDAQRDALAVLDNCSKHLRINDRDVLAYARRGLTLLVLGRDNDAAPDLARFRELVPHMSPYLQRVIELAHHSQGGTPPAPLAGESGLLSARLIDGVFAGSA